MPSFILCLSYDTLDFMLLKTETSEVYIHSQSLQNNFYSYLGITYFRNYYVCKLAPILAALFNAEL